MLAKVQRLTPHLQRMHKEVYKNVCTYRSEQSQLRAGQDEVLHFLQTCLADIHRDMLAGDDGTGKQTIKHCCSLHCKSPLRSSCNAKFQLLGM